jgi:hypothetical protein
MCQGAGALQQLLFLALGRLPPLPDAPLGLAGVKFLMLRIGGTSVVGRSLHRGLVMSTSPTQRMPYLPR